MWRCAVADDAPKHPYVRTLNGHQGRAQWLFEEAVGSAAEHAEIERLRAEFAANRSHQKHSSDALYRLSCVGRRKSRTLPRVPGTKLSETAAVTEADVQDAMKAGAAYYATLQVRDCFASGKMVGDHCQCLTACSCRCMVLGGSCSLWPEIRGAGAPQPRSSHLKTASSHHYMPHPAAKQKSNIPTWASRNRRTVVTGQATTAAPCSSCPA